MPDSYEGTIRAVLDHGSIVSLWVVSDASGPWRFVSMDHRMFQAFRGARTALGGVRVRVTGKHPFESIAYADGEDDDT